MKIGIIGAGFAGLSTAKVLKELGHDITVYEKAPDVGGVWSKIRRYPGLRTQNNKGTYALSGRKMGRHVHQWAAGEHVQEYMAQYAQQYGLEPYLRLGTEVTKAQPADGGGWDVTTKDGTEHFEHLVLASGIFSRPFIPPFKGMDVMEKLGGIVMAPGDFHSLDQVRGKNVLVVGYGKSACDVTVEIAKVAGSTTVVARELLWKLPRKVGGLVNYKLLMLTRLGENLFPYQRISGFAKVLHAGGSKMANSMLGTVEKVTTRQLKLKKLGLVPEGTFGDIARATVSLATEGFFEGALDGSINVVRDTVIEEFVDVDGQPHARLSNGTTIPADVVIAATGWTQEIPFLPESVTDKLYNEDGDFLLYNFVHPIDIPDLSFAGYNSSFFSPLSAEVSAIWIGSLLGGNHTLPSREEMIAQTQERLHWMRERSRGQHARGTNVIPFSLHTIDEKLNEMGLNVSPFTRLKQWLLPPNPGNYKNVNKKLAKRLGVKAG